MNQPHPIPGRPWRVLALVLLGLLVAVAVASVAALLLTRSVGSVADRALRSDIALEDEAEDVLVAVLEVRQYQRTLGYTGPTRAALAEFDAAYQGLVAEIGELAEVDVDPALTDTDGLLRMAVAYHDAFRPALALFQVDPDAFDAANDQGLVDLAALQDRAEALDRLGEERSTAALGDVESATTTATMIMLLVLVGVTVGGLALTFVAWRVLRELRMLAAAQQATADQLRDALRARTDLIADASHELRTPLTVLRGNAEVGLAMGPEGCAHEPILHEIVAESARMTRLVEDLLFLARSGAGPPPLEPRELDADHGWPTWPLAEVLCQHAESSWYPPAVEGRSPRPGADGAAIMVLIDNAAKFSPAGASSPRRHLDGALLVVEVEDQGPGIAPELLHHVFDRFRRGDKARGGRQSGAGLGLSIAQAIVQGHDGSIAPDATVASGTRMVIRVPVMSAHPAAGLHATSNAVR